MIKKLVLVFIAVLAIKSYGQAGTASPYSFYGIGSLKFKGTVENRSMGGLSIYTDSIHINLRNPASYAGNNLSLLNNESRPVKFTIGGSHSSSNLQSNSGSAKTSSSTFDYLAIALPVGKFGVGFGLLPYTSVGYKLESINDQDALSNRFRGEGGLNKAFLGLGYQITPQLSVGFDLQYNFGNIQNSAIAFLYDTDGNLTQYQSKESNRSDLSGLNLNMGISYKTPLTTKLEFISGLTLSPESKLTALNQRSFSTIRFNAAGQEIISGITNIDLQAIGLYETDLVMPAKYAIGAGLGNPRNWFVGAEYTLQKTSNFANSLYTNTATTYQDAHTFALGGFYIPQYNSFSNYLKQIVYRAGLHVEKTGLLLNNESINEFGISFGLGLPVGSFFTNANLGFEFGKRGTVSSNLIKENFVNFQLSLSLNDRWFQKRKYD